MQTPLSPLLAVDPIANLAHDKPALLMVSGVSGLEKQQSHQHFSNL